MLHQQDYNKLKSTRIISEAQLAELCPTIPQLNISQEERLTQTIFKNNQVISRKK